ncbi:16978_t:CDS:2 [Entrophospora sp. SA101]|nr:16978_t:CDS:2 [Entrophospora sp. SA101]
MDDFRRFREQNNSSSRNELFAGATNNNNQSGYGYGQGGGGYPRPEEDVEEIKSQIHSVKQDSVNSTQRSLRLIQEAQNSGEKTLNKLGEQTQRINYTENKLELAEIHAQRAADNASKLKKASFKII